VLKARKNLSHPNAESGQCVVVFEYLILLALPDLAVGAMNFDDT